MIPFQERKKIRKILYSKVTLVILFVSLVAVGRGAWDIHKKAVVAQTERDITKRSLAELNARTVELKSSLTDLKSTEGIEAAVRQKYTVVKPGEDVVVVVDDSMKKGENGEAVNSKSFWSQFLSFFGF